MTENSASGSQDTAALFQHIGLKGIQAGAIVGTFISAPAAAIRHKRRGGMLDADFRPRAFRAMNTTTLAITSFSYVVIHVVLAGLGLIGGKEGFDQEKIGDRVYRLQHNEGQNRCDQFAYGGALAGAISSCLRGFPKAANFAGSTLLGTAAGVLLHVLTSERSASGQVETFKHSAQNVIKEL